MRSLLITAFLFLTACSRPDYITAEELAGSHENGGACSIQFAGNCATLTWQNPPSSTGSSPFTLQFQNPLTTEQLSVVLWMPSMGHGSAPVTISTSDQQTFQITDVYFIMPGDWEVRIYLQNGATTEQYFVPLMLQ